jgi:hypothetical protein
MRNGPAVDGNHYADRDVLTGQRCDGLDEWRYPARAQSAPHVSALERQREGSGSGRAKEDEIAGNGLAVEWHDTPYSQRVTRGEIDPQAAGKSGCDHGGDDRSANADNDERNALSLRSPRKAKRSDGRARGLLKFRVGGLFHRSAPGLAAAVPDPCQSLRYEDLANVDAVDGKRCERAVMPVRSEPDQGDRTPAQEIGKTKLGLQRKVCLDLASPLDLRRVDIGEPHALSVTSKSDPDGISVPDPQHRRRAGRGA